MHATTQKIKSTSTRYGSMNYYHDDQYIGHALEKYGEYSEGEPELWRKFVHIGDTVIDVGANIGAHTLALADMVGAGGSVLAFEPQIENYQLLLQNVRGVSQAYIYRIAMGSAAGKISAPKLDELPHHNYGGVELGHGGNKVEVRTLDDMTSTAFGHISFVKIDVEGMEAEVLRGAKRMIGQHRPVLYVENDRPDKSDELLTLIFDMGYQIYDHRPYLYSPHNYKKAELGSDHSNIISLNLLCIPAEKISEFGHVIEGLKRIKREVLSSPTSKKGWACVVRLGGIGDNLIAASPLKLLKQQGYMVEVISQEPQCCVFHNNPYIDKLTIKSARELPQNDPVAWQKYWWSRSCEYAKFVNLSHSVEVLMANFQQSTSFWWPAEFRRKMCGQSYLEAAHDLVGVKHEFGPLFFPSQTEVEDIADFKARHGLNDRPLIAWVVAGTRIDKLYPYSALVIARLLSELDVNVIMLAAPAGSGRDAEHTKAIMEHVKLANSSTRGLYEARAVEGQHDWSIRRMLTLARFSDLVIGPDTGVMWAVAMENNAKIVLHSHASADNITKHWHNTVSLKPNNVKCWPCHLLHDSYETCQETQIQAGMKPGVEDKGAACISSLSVDLVTTAAKLLLGSDHYIEHEQAVIRN